MSIDLLMSIKREYGVGEDVDEVRGRKLGLNEGRNLAIKSLSQNGMSNEGIANGLIISIKKVEKILNSKNLKLKIQKQLFAKSIISCDTILKSLQAGI